MSQEEIRQHLQEWFSTETELKPDDTVTEFNEIAEKIAISLKEKIAIDKCIGNLKQYLSEQPITYDSSFDSVCIIVDRDQQIDNIIQQHQGQSNILFIVNQFMGHGKRN